MTPAFLKASEVAALLGFSADHFNDPRKGPRARLFAAGFPQPDPILGKYHRGAVEAWIEQRGRIGGGVDNLGGGSGINLDAA